MIAFVINSIRKIPSKSEVLKIDIMKMTIITTELKKRELSPNSQGPPVFYYVRRAGYWGR